ncbi:MAG: TetR/AcrR family transcriptional regulator [Rhodobacter sp.]|nr:TetR/AcrR family transcriptional regulator [Rhodobacter sp.]
MARTIAKDHDQKRINILKTAARVFATDGIARASMSQVAKACGISKANIYHYYDGKDALLFDILDTYLRSLRDQMAGLSLDGLSPEEKLRQIVRATLLAYEGMDAEHKIQTEGIPQLPEDQQDVLKTYQRDMVRQLSAVLRELSPRAFDGNSRKLHSATMSIYGMLNWFYVWNQGADKKTRQDYASLVSDLALNGLKGL